jgi:N,N'-diacetylchitobiose transport system permease protein
MSTTAPDVSVTPTHPGGPAGGDEHDAVVHGGRPSSKRARLATPYILIAPALVLLAALLGYPIYRMIVLSFQKFELRQLIGGKAAEWIGLDNYTKLLDDEQFWATLRRTLIFTGAAVSISLVLGLLVALLMRRVSGKIRIAMIVAMMFAWSMPQLVSSQVFKWMFDADFGVLNWLIDQIPGVDFHKHSWFIDPMQGWMVITTLVVWGAIPFLAITLYAGLSQVPRELQEAATVDGASALRVFRHITLPILKPLIVIVTTLSVIWDFQLFTQVWVLRDSKPELDYQTLSTYAFSLAFGQGKYGFGSAIALITVVLLLGVMAFYVRQMFKIGDAD